MAKVLKGSGIGPLISTEEGRARLDAYASGCEVGGAQAKRDMQFLLRQLKLMEHDQDEEGIARVAKRNGIAIPLDIYSQPTTLDEWDAMMDKKSKRKKK